MAAKRESKKQKGLRAERAGAAELPSRGKRTKTEKFRPRAKERKAGKKRNRAAG